MGLAATAVFDCDGCGHEEAVDLDTYDSAADLELPFGWVENEGGELHCDSCQEEELPSVEEELDDAVAALNKAVLRIEPGDRPIDILTVIDNHHKQSEPQSEPSKQPNKRLVAV